MSRCHNADVLTLTSYISSNMNENFQLEEKPKIVSCKIIRDNHGNFIPDGRKLDIITVLDPEIFGFNDWLKSFIFALDEAV